MLSEDQKSSFAKQSVLGRWAMPEELAGPALVLASEADSYITGTTMEVDGGVLANIF